MPKLPKRGVRGRARPKRENMLIPSKEDLQDVLKVCDPLEKAILLVGVSSGLSSNEIQNLRYSDFINGYDPNTRVTTLSLRRGKTGIDFFTFLNPEASQAVIDYLEFRTRTTKTGTAKREKQLEKQRIIEDGYLFILRNVPDSYLETRDEEERKLCENNITKLYRGLSDKAKKNTKKGTWNTIRSHAMRKYFNSTLINNGCSPYQADLWLGHELGESKGAYIIPNKEKQKELYMQYMGFLTIEKQMDVSENPDYIKMKAQNESFARIAAISAVESRELQELREKDTEREKKLQELGEEIEKLKSLESNRAKLQEEFKPIIEEAKQRMKTVEEYFQPPFDDLIQGLNATETEVLDIYVPASDEYRAFEERLKTDKEYAQKWKEFRRRNVLEKAKQEKEKEIINRIQKTLFE